MNTTISVDTYKTVNRLMEKGFTKEQAEGVIDVLTESELVTKSDLKVAVSELKTWVVLMLLAQAGLIVAVQNLLAS